MGHVEVKVKIGNPLEPTGTFIEETALVDTGATFTTVPRSISQRLGLRTIGKRKVRTATQFETLDESFTTLKINGNLAVSPLLVSDKIERILVGVITLEALSLTVDPTTGSLKETETYLL